MRYDLKQKSCGDAGCDGSLTIRTHFIDRSVWWQLWAGPVHGLPVLPQYSDAVIENPSWSDEIEFDITNAMQAFVSRSGHSPYDRALLRFTRVDPTDTDTFFVQRGMCFNWYQCAPRFRIQWGPP